MKMERSHRTAGLSAAAAIGVLLVLGFDASAQEKSPPPKAASPCKGLDEKSCKAKTADCLWIVPTKGKQKPYCRLKAASTRKS
jgi:hypothetical protein